MVDFIPVALGRVPVGGAIRALFGAGLLWLAAGCRGQAKDPGRDPAANARSQAPAWVTRGSGVFRAEGASRIFCGVGAFSGSRGAGTLREQSRRNAEEALATVTAGYLRLAARRFSRLRASAAELAMEESVATAGRLNHSDLRASCCAGAWYYDRARRVEYARRTLDAGNFLRSVCQDARLDAEFREFVLQNAESLLDEVEKNPSLLR